MKLSTAAAVLAALSSTHAFVVKPVARPAALQLHMSTTEEASTSTSASKKEDRLRFMKSSQFYRKGFKEVREDVEQTMQNQFKSDVVDELKSNNYVIERDGVKVHLAKVRTNNESKRKSQAQYLEYMNVSRLTQLHYTLCI
jgi:4-hydroxy-3-methylbut-2-enyl diphosphate reductase